MGADNLSRRQFLVGGATVLVVTRDARALISNWVTWSSSGDPELHIVDPSNQLRLKVRVVSFEADGRRLIAKSGARIIFIFPPQHIEEQVVLETAETDNQARESILRPGVRIFAQLGARDDQQPDRLAFSIAEGSGFRNLEELFELVESDQARLIAERNIGSNTTCLELPYLIRSQPKADDFYLRIIRKSDNDGWYPLAALSLIPKNAAGGAFLLRELVLGFSRGPLEPDDQAPPFAAGTWRSVAVPVNSRVNLFEHLTKGGRQATSPILAKRLTFTSLGGNFELAGEWDSGTIGRYRHQSFLGRTDKETLVHRGYLFPTGHPALLVEDTTRVFHRFTYRGESFQVSYLKKELFCEIKQPVKAYNDDAQRLGGLKFIRILRSGGTLNTKDGKEIDSFRTPSLDRLADLEMDPIKPSYTRKKFVDLKEAPRHLKEEPDDKSGSGLNSRLHPPPLALWLKVRGVNFQFPVEFEAAGSDTVVRSSMALAFVGAAEGSVPDDDESKYFAAPKAVATALSKFDQTVGIASCFGEPLNFVLSKSDQNLVQLTKPTVSLRLGGEKAVEAPGFKPRLAQASVSLPEFAAMFPEIPTVDIQLSGDVDVPIKLISEINLAVDPKLSGAFVVPKISFGGISKVHGPIPAGFGNGTFAMPPVPKMLNGFTLLGIFPIEHLLDVPSLRDFAAKLPTFQYPTVGTTLRYCWDTPLTKNWDAGLFKFTPRSCHLHVCAGLTRDGHPTGTALLGNPDESSTNPGFEVAIANLLLLKVGYIKTNFSGNTSTTKVERVSLQFDGDLKFLQKLQDSLGNLFGDGGLRIRSDALEIFRAFELPNMQLGIVGISNIRLVATIAFIFDNGMSFCLALNEKYSPFTANVGFLGGGGFFQITFGRSGSLALEVAIEVGGILAINFGVARGSVSAMVGIYFRYDVGKGVVIEGYLRVSGCVSILAIVSISVTYYASLQYDSANSKLAATCWVEVRIKIAFIRKTVRFRATHEYKLSSESTLFASVGSLQTTDRALEFSNWMTRKQFSEYVNAYAS